MAHPLPQPQEAQNYLSSQPQDTQAEIEIAPEIQLVTNVHNALPCTSERAAMEGRAAPPAKLEVPTVHVSELSYGLLLAAVCCSLVVGAAAGGGAVHWDELRRRAAYAQAASSDGGCADYRSF